MVRGPNGTCRLAPSCPRSQLGFRAAASSSPNPMEHLLTSSSEARLILPPSLAALGGRMAVGA